MNLYGMVDSSEVIKWIEDKGVKPLFLAVSGSHMWGVARPDSDIDIRGVYLDPIEKVLSLYPGRDTIEAQGILGKDCDLQLYELGKALGMLNKHNGNLVELIESPTCFYDNKMLDWHALANKFLTKKLVGYYAGYYMSQRKRAAQNRGGKALLYTYRTVMTGIVLMRTGKIILDFYELKRTFEEMYNWHSWLLDAFLNREDWKQPVSDERLNLFECEWEQFCAILDDAKEHSSLPETYDGYDELNSILLQHRLECAKMTLRGEYGR